MRTGSILKFDAQWTLGQFSLGSSHFQWESPSKFSWWFSLKTIVNFQPEGEYYPTLDYTSSTCESKKKGTVMPSMVLWTTQIVDLITLRCKRNEPSTTTKFNQYWGYIISRVIIVSCSRNCLFSFSIRIWVASIHEFFTIKVGFIEIIFMNLDPRPIY